MLGFWFADGYMRKEKSYRVLFTSADRQILLHIRRALSSSHPIKGRKDARSGSYAWTLSLCSKHLYTALQSLGGFRQKSRTMRFPCVPFQYLPDFVRGYFDGDGSVFFVKYIRTKDKRPARELRTNFTSGSRQFLEKLMQVLHNEINLPVKQLGIYDSGSSFKLGYGIKDSDSLLRYMYYANFPIGLKRKADYVFKIPKYQIHNMPGWRNR